MIVFDEAGNTLEGEGLVESSARCIHAPIHRITGVRVVMHTHQTWTLALNMLDDNRLIPASQTAAYLDGHIAYDDDYRGGADSLEDGEHLAHLLGDNSVMFMKNHGVIVTANTIAEAFRRLYPAGAGVPCTDTRDEHRTAPVADPPAGHRATPSTDRETTCMRGSARICTSRQ